MTSRHQSRCAKSLEVWRGKLTDEEVIRIHASNSQPLKVQDEKGRQTENPPAFLIRRVNSQLRVVASVIFGSRKPAATKVYLQRRQHAVRRAKAASRLLRHSIHSSRRVPSLTWVFDTFCSATVVSHCGSLISAVP